MATALQRLQFIIGMTNNVSGPLAQINNSVHTTTRGIQDGFAKAGLAIAAVAGVGYSLKSIIDPTREFNNALNEVRSMGVAEDVMKSLGNTALEFSMQYGQSAADFVKASYDIQGAISTLKGSELAEFTRASAILAKGTKADVAEITNYVGTMYGIFQKDADRMGKANWIQQMVGQSAQAINVFKSDGHKMSEAFKGLGATATAAGIAMGEQFTILGSLQATMEGGESATKYRSFLNGIGAAQKALNLRFTDTQGKMLGVVPILEAIKKKYGEIDTVAESDALKKAFGTDEAVAMIKLLLPQVDILKNNIADIGNIKGMENAEKMAKTMIDPWSRLDAGVTALSISIGEKLVPQLMPMIDGMNNGMATLIKWNTMFPYLSAEIDKAILPVIGLTLASAVLFATGNPSVLTLAWRAFQIALIPLAPLFAALNVAWRIFLMELYAGGGILSALRVGFIAFGGQLVMLATSLWGAVTAAGAWTMALLANPITWIVVGVVALSAALVYAIYNWDSITAATNRWFNLVRESSPSTVAALSSAFEWLANFHPIDGLIQDFNELLAVINRVTGAKFSIGGSIQTSVSSSIPVPGTGKNALKSSVSNVLNQSSQNSSRSTVVNINNHAKDLTNARLAQHLQMAGG